MKIIFRADGNTVTGLGHIMRSSALMQMLQPHFDCLFWTGNKNYFPFRDFDNPPEVNDFFFNDLLHEAKQIIKIVPSDSVIVLDGYQFTTTYQKTLKDAGLKLVCIDDIAACHYVSDVIINHAGGIKVTDYSIEPYSELFLGPRYALVKPLFFKEPKPERNLNDRHILVSLGGSDPNNETTIVLNKLVENAPKFTAIHVIAGAANVHFDKMVEKFQAYKSISFYKNLSASEMYMLMRLCNYAVLSPSTICYEYMSIGGIVYLHQIADNQERIRKYFIENGFAFDFLSEKDIEKWELQKSLEYQAQVFDGKSPERLKNIFKKLLHVS